MEIGQVYDSFYGNGQSAETVRIVRMTAKSVFYKKTFNGAESDIEWRESKNTFTTLLDKGLYKLRPTNEKA